MTTETAPQIVSKQTEAAAALGVSEEEWSLLKEQPGFPGREKAGWNITALQAWVRDATFAEPSGEITIDESVETISDPVPLTPRATVHCEKIVIELPICTPEDGSYIASQMGRLNTRLDRDTQLAGFCHVHAGLRAINATFPDGRPIDGAPDVVKFIFGLIQQQLQQQLQQDSA